MGPTLDADHDLLTDVARRRLSQRPAAFLGGRQDKLGPKFGLLADTAAMSSVQKKAVPRPATLTGHRAPPRGVARFSVTSTSSKVDGVAHAADRRRSATGAPYGEAQRQRCGDCKMPGLHVATLARQAVHVNLDTTASRLGVLDPLSSAVQTSDTVRSRMRAPSRAAAPMVLFLLGGCGIQFSNLDSSAKVAPGGGEAIVVLAVTPRSRVSLFEGESQGPEWTCKSLFNIANVFPESGFIVLKLKPRTGNKNYGIGQVLPDGIGGESFIVRRDVGVPVFHAPAGKVTFVGGIHLTRNGEHLRIGARRDDYGGGRGAAFENLISGTCRQRHRGTVLFLRADGGC